MNEYKAAFIKESTHRELKILSVELGLTIDQTVERLMHYYEANQDWELGKKEKTLETGFN